MSLSPDFRKVDKVDGMGGPCSTASICHSVFVALERDGGWCKTVFSEDDALVTVFPERKIRTPYNVFLLTAERESSRVPLATSLLGPGT